MAATDTEAAQGESDMAREDPAQRFSREEEASLVSESNAHRTAANSLFSSAQFQAALAKYDEAIAACPNYLGYELAVLKSNVAACHLKLEEWKEAVDSATAALDALDRLERDDQHAGDEQKAKAEEARREREEKRKEAEEEEDEVEEVIVSSGAHKAAPAPPRAEEGEGEGEEEGEDAAEAARRRRRADTARIRAKALMRRARARAELGGWSSLAGAEEDYRALAGMDNLGAADRRTVQAQLRALPPRTEAAQEREMGEMWGKLKDLGNGILKPFGLSTENFQMVKDEKTGGYSMNFQQ